MNRSDACSNSHGGKGRRHSDMQSGATDADRAINGARDASPRFAARAEGDAFGQRPKKSSSNAYARGSDQNCGNMLTDTPTTRVHAPPGGASSLSLGWDYEPSRPEPQGGATPRTPRSGAAAPAERSWREEGQGGAGSQVDGDRRRQSAWEEAPADRDSVASSRWNAQSSCETDSRVGDMHGPSHGGRAADGPAGRPSFDAGALRTLKAHVQEAGVE